MLLDGVLVVEGAGHELLGQRTRHELLALVVGGRGGHELFLVVGRTGHELLLLVVGRWTGHELVLVVG